MSKTQAASGLTLGANGYTGGTLAQRVEANVALIERVRASVVADLKSQGKINATTADGYPVIPNMKLWKLDKTGIHAATWPLDPKGVYYKSKQIATINFAITLLKGVK